jgi:hypothetical protein
MPEPINENGFTLTPVDYDPFAPRRPDPTPRLRELTDEEVMTPAGYTLTPVEGNPFADSERVAAGWNAFLNAPDPLDPLDPGISPDTVPPAFYERVRKGAALERMTKRVSAGLQEGWGDEPNISDQQRRDLENIGIFARPGETRPITLMMDPFNRATIEPTAAALNTLMRGVNAGVAGAAALYGQLLEEMGDTNSRAAEHEMAGFINFRMIDSGMGAFARPHITRDNVIHMQPVGGLPNAFDFRNAAQALGEVDPLKLTTEENLRQLWWERGIHPAEAAFDATVDKFFKDDLIHGDPNPIDRSDTAPATGSPIIIGTPRSALAKTGDPHIDALIDADPVTRAIDSPVIDRGREVPGGASISSPPYAPVVFIDRNVPTSISIGDMRFDPAEPLAVRATVARAAMQMLARGGMDAEAAARVAADWAGQAEAAWYRSHLIDQARVEEVLKHFIGEQPPLEKPSTEELARAREITERAEEGGDLRPGGADVTDPTNLPTLEQQPPPAPGSLVVAMRGLVTKLFDIGADMQMWLSPMVRGSRAAQALAKDFANSIRRNRWEWARIDQNIVNSPALKAARDRTGETPEQQRLRMWNAVDEESVARQLGEDTQHQGLVTLEPEERAVVDDLMARSQAAWLQARDLGLVEGDGLPAYTPRMLIHVAMGGRQAVPLNVIGRNLRVRTEQMLRRKHLTAEETEAAAKERVRAAMEKAGASPDEIEAAVAGVAIARDIRALPLATAKLEDAIAGRLLIDAIQEYGRATGNDAVSIGTRPDKTWFTLPEHSAFYRWQPRMRDGAPVRDEAGEIVFDRVPIFVHGDFEGPLRAVLTQPTNKAYSALMALKGKVMSLVMYSPAIHNIVEFGRAFPAMPTRIFRVYWDGNRAKHDVATMREAIDGGLVPIGHRFFNQDISSIMEEPSLQPGRSWTAQVLGYFPGLFDPEKGAAVKAAIDKAGDFWHNTLLWDRVGDLQMGLYVNFRGDLIRKGVDPLTASRVAAHLANRYAGALPQEAMSAGATAVANMAMFSRTFTMGNMGVMKDAFGHIPAKVLNPLLRAGGLPELQLGETGGLPRDVMAQIRRDLDRSGGTAGDVESAALYARRLAQRKAIATVALDVALMYIGYSLFQSMSNVLLMRDRSASEELNRYVKRARDVIDDVKVHPFSLLQPLTLAEHLSATSENEPGLQNRILIGHLADGTAIYARNPVGKIGEEFIGWATSPLATANAKLSTFARPMLQVFTNDKGFGRKVYDPNAETPAQYAGAIWGVVKHIVEAQTPEGQISAFGDLVTGDGDPTYNALSIGLPLVGITTRKGAPGGQAAGELYHAQDIHRYQVETAMPAIRLQIQRGDIEGARAAMTDLGISPSLQRFYIKTTQNPALRVSPHALRDFFRPGFATPQMRERMRELRQ